jgi:adenosylhomocysteine nucleosidase
MRILVTFAVEAEFAPWRRLRDLEHHKIGDIDVWQAKIGRAAVDFVVTGMGVENAERVAGVVLSQEHAFCVAAGFAGALRPEHKIGNVLVADAIQFLGKSKTLMCGPGLVKNARQDGAFRAKMFLTSDHIVRSPEEKAQLAPFADAVDMESFGVLSAAQDRNRPAVAIRVISDRFDHDIPVDIEMTMDEKRGTIRIGGVLHYMGKHPLNVPALIRLGRDSKTASEALANFLEAFIKKISFSSHGWPPPELQEVAAR